MRGFSAPHAGDIGEDSGLFTRLSNDAVTWNRTKWENDTGVRTEVFRFGGRL